jgi:transcriptional regulator with XRE-family HTH domain
MTFAKTLERVREKAKMTCYVLARESRVDSTYLARLERGEKVRPSRQLVLRLGQALLDNSGDISLKDVNRLLRAAGYGPLPRNRVSILPRKR